MSKRIAILLAALTGLALLAQDYPRRIPVGLVAGYTFDHADPRNITESAAGVTLTSGSPSFVNGALQLSSTTDGYTTTLGGTLSSSSVSWSLWIKPSSSAGTTYIINHFNGGNRLYLGVTGGAYQIMCENLSWTSTGVTATTGVWRHFVLSYNGSALSCYVDGVFAVSDPGVLAITPSGFFIGQAAVGSTPGLYDDVRVYNYPLSATEAAQLYQDTRNTSRP